MAPKGEAKWLFDPSSGLVIPLMGESFKDLGTTEIQNLARFSFKPHPTEANDALRVTPNNGKYKKKEKNPKL